MRALAAIAIVSLLGCGSSSRPERPPPERTPAQTSAPPPGPPRTARLVPTTALEPRTFHIALEDLPPPSDTEDVRQRPEVVDPPADARLRVPAGFEVNVLADGLAMPRWLRITPSGEILVTETRENRITLLADRDGDGAAEERAVFADDDRGQRLDIPFGMAFAGGFFFVGNQDEVRRWPYRAGQRALEGEGERITELPGGGYHQHWTRNVVVSPDGSQLYVSIGSQSNADPDPLPRASVQVMGLDGSGRRTFASGLRNPVGLAFHPRTGALWTTVNERDELGDDLVPDYLAHLEDGQFYGWPWVYLAPDRRDPRLARRPLPEEARRTVTPEVLFQAHSAALGIAFYDGATFPERYRGSAFVAFRGSWNRRLGTGYGIALVPFDESGRPRGGYQEFLDGFLLDPEVPRVWGRPVGVVIAPDGSLLFTEETNGRIYRVQWVGERR
ncbi:PQQ-dependent sugar dehydrogenase [Sandaracinus amylolyticus]|uniref:PQQ-dependent sugar dehydrogenase n=1 Tax=Sandaracinus amylolyticus TaxID=927083 RepID=UPI001F343770|nr:sorbosone dehydrogenase family protein [Sandaracinus amylolyticus]UJR79138.1 L-sorbosone dehydrogenase [Sandaracinus amylolyticus]